MNPIQIPSNICGSELTEGELEHLSLVTCYPGAKLNETAWSTVNGECVANWAKLEKLDLIRPVGSYKWKPTQKLIGCLLEVAVAGMEEIKKRADVAHTHYYTTGSTYGAAGATLDPVVMQKLDRTMNCILVNKSGVVVTGTAFAEGDSNKEMEAAKMQAYFAAIVKAPNVMN